MPEARCERPPSRGNACANPWCSRTDAPRSADHSAPKAVEQARSAGPTVNAGWNYGIIHWLILSYAVVSRFSRPSPKADVLQHYAYVRDYLRKEATTVTLISRFT